MAEICDHSITQAAINRYSAHNTSPMEKLELACDQDDPAAVDNLEEVTRVVNRFVQVGRHDLAANFISNKDSGTQDKRSALERIIAQNQLMSVSFFARGTRAAMAVCRIAVRNHNGQLLGYGTGFMVSPQLMMTNNHVLNNVNSASVATIQFDHALSVQGPPMQPKEFRLKPEVFFMTSDAKKLDYAVIAVEPVNNEGYAVADRGWINLIPDSGKAITGEPLNIIQHPAGEMMQIAIRENKALGPDGDFFIYTTDTKRGSSGSPVLNDQWQVAALHHAGVPKTDTAGNWLRKDGLTYRENIDDPSSIDWIANEGVRISRIVANLKAQPITPEKKEKLDQVFESPGNSLINPEIIEKPSPVHPINQPFDTAVIGPDNIARWNFQLTFGPTGIPDGVKTQQLSGVSQPATSTISQPAASPTIQESVFQNRGPYYDHTADAAAKSDYYSVVAGGLNKGDFYKTLNALLTTTHTKVFSYKSARHDHLYPWIDRHENETLASIYSSQEMAEELFLAEVHSFDKAKESLALSQGLEASTLSEKDIEAIDLSLEASTKFNCEHVVPQSWFEGDAEHKAQKSDLHHLFTCESNCNSFRNNIPYSEFNEEEEAKINANEVSLAEAIINPALEAARPSCGLRDGRRFEPIRGKGPTARATLYFVLRYPGVVGDIKSGKKKEFVKSNVEILLKWAEAEPPTVYEQHRNCEIAKVQGNRNPLIDHPEWLRQIDFKKGFG